MRSEMEQTEAALSEGVALLLQRMKSHPEEFDMEHGKWSDVLINVYHKTHTASTSTVLGIPPDAWMSPSEAETIWRTYVQLKQKRFHSWVMEALLTGETEEDKSGSVYKTVPHPSRKSDSWQTVATQISSAPIVGKLKQELGIK